MHPIRECLIENHMKDDAERDVSPTVVVDVIVNHRESRHAYSQSGYEERFVEDVNARPLDIEGDLQISLELR